MHVQRVLIDRVGCIPFTFADSSFLQARTTHSCNKTFFFFQDMHGRLKMISRLQAHLSIYTSVYVRELQEKLQPSRINVIAYLERLRQVDRLRQVASGRDRRRFIFVSSRAVILPSPCHAEQKWSCMGGCTVVTYYYRCMFDRTI